MFTILNHTKNVKRYSTRPSQYSDSVVFKDASDKSVKAYRDAVLWNFLCSEDRIDLADLVEYWRIIDAIMDLSLQSAKHILQTRYNCRVKKLRPRRTNRKGSGINHEVYKLKYKNNQGTDRELLANALLIEVIDLLKEEAEGLRKQR